MAPKGKWAAGIVPRNFSWVIKDRLAVCERPGGYGANHRRVRRQEEIIWIREQGFTCVVTLIPSPHNLHNYDELGVAWRHLPFGQHDDAHTVLKTLFPELAGMLAAGGKVLAPGDPDLPLQLIDARDLGAFLLDSGTSGTPGTFNVTGPRGNATMGSWLGDAVTATGSDARLTWVDDAFLLEREVQAWTELPLWMPRGQAGDHVWDADTGAAERAGLRVRPVTQTVRDTWTWMQGGGRAAEDPPHAHLARHGIEPDKEHRILADWSARS